ncbi:MAG TPA: hypothetical protein VNQ76_02280 [Planctomicrobium sp.]|nr:hypothetical protein [Planctomicrobium sp.]
MIPKICKTLTFSAVTAFVATAGVVAAGMLSQELRHILFSRNDPSYQTLDELFRTHRSMGYTVLHQPRDNKKYRIMGAIADNDPNSTHTTIRGTFAVEDGRQIHFEVPKPADMEISVEGLKPEDQGALQYVVFARPYGKHD